MKPDDLAVLTREVHIRLLNCSGTGCLVETNVPLAVSTVGVLTLQFEGNHFTDAVLVAWCGAVSGGGPTYRAGLRFVWTAGIPPDSLRMMAHRLLAEASSAQGSYGPDVANQ